MSLAVSSPTLPQYLPAPDSSLRSFQASHTDLSLVSSTRHLDLNMVTAEGDKVTLSLDSRLAALSSASEQGQVNDDGRLDFERSRLSIGLYQREMSFTVEGDLNAAELRDIRKVLKTLNKMMNKFVKGELSTLQKQALSLQGLNTVAGLEADLSYNIQTLDARQTTATYDNQRQPVDFRPTSLPTADPPPTELFFLRGGERDRGLDDPHDPI